DRRLYTATKVPPRNRRWPSRRGDRLDNAFPADYIRELTQRSLENLGLPRIDLLQFHVWEDDWADDERWQRAVDDLKRQGLVEGVGVSVNRWEPANVVRTLRTGLIDAARSSTTSSTRPRRTSYSPCAGSWASRSSPACRSTRGRSPAR